MTYLTLHRGDLFSSTADGIGHGVNTRGVMGKGIAPLFRQKYAGMYEAYRAACSSGRLIGGGVFVWSTGTVTIYNIASQETLGKAARLDFLEAGVRAALMDADGRGVKTIALPRIGCGIGGLDWAEVHPLLAALASQFRCDLEVWSL